MRKLFDRVFNGSDIVYGLAESTLNKTIEELGENTPIAMPNTAYFLANIYAYTGKKVTNLSELRDVMTYVKDNFKSHSSLTGSVFDAGIGTAIAAEVIEACKYAKSPEPYTAPYNGHFADSNVREMGVPLVTGDTPGFVVIIGPAPSDEAAAELIRGYQSRAIFCFLIGGIIDQAIRMNIDMGFNVRVVAVGPDISSVAHVTSFVVRTAMIFGNVQPGDRESFDEYTIKRISAFINAFAPLDDIAVACGGAAIGMGFPVITNDTQDVMEVPKSLIVQTDTTNFIETSLEARDIKIKVTNIDIPVAFSTAFEGEIIRRKDMQVDIDGSRVGCFELVKSREIHEVEDHSIQISGPDFDTVEPGSRFSLGVIVEVAGKNMQSDFEPVIERKLHQIVNCIEGVMHTGQRDLIRIRVSKSAYEAGFRVRHIGEALYAKVKSEYEAIVDKCQVRIYTVPEEINSLRAEAGVIYDKRNERLRSLTDDSVDVFYNCILCQSFSPAHVCIVTPERLGLCGAISWLDAKATYELDPNGPCQVVTKNEPIDERLGIWADVNESVKNASHGAFDRLALYSIMQDPMTSCGCFECICGVEPVTGGVVIVNREHIGMTPLGMTFSEMAAMTGGGVQTPGFMGHGKHFIPSKKFMSADGGSVRIVWMPKALKEFVGERLDKTVLDVYCVEDFTSKIADETITEDAEALLGFITENSHPVLGMSNLLG